MGHAIRVGAISVPGVIAISKILYPEVEESKTANRRLFSYHPSVSRFTQLLTDVWISSIGTTVHHIILITAMVVATGLVSQSMSVIIRILDIVTIPINSLSILSNLILPVIMLVGITDITEAHTTAFNVFRRLLVSKEYGAFFYSSFLHQRWALDCVNATRQNVSVQHTWNDESYFIRVKVDGTTLNLPGPELTHKTLFISLTLIIGLCGVIT